MNYWSAISIIGTTHTNVRALDDADPLVEGSASIPRRLAESAVGFILAFHAECELDVQIKVPRPRADELEVHGRHRIPLVLRQVV
jgi:hypothetical protein